MLIEFAWNEEIYFDNCTFNKCCTIHRACLLGMPKYSNTLQQRPFLRQGSVIFFALSLMVLNTNLPAGFALRAAVTTQDRLISAEKSGIPMFAWKRIHCFMLYHIGHFREQQDTWQHCFVRHDSWCVYWMYSGQFAPRLMHAKDLMSACQAMAVASGSFQPFHLSYNIAEGDHKHWQLYL